MKKLITLILLIIIVVVMAKNLLADNNNIFMVDVNKEADNFYSFVSGSAKGIIQTKNCYEFAYNDHSAMKYDKYTTYGNKLMFSNGKVCDIKDVYFK